MAEDELPVFNGIGSGYGWSISAWQFWNRRGTPEAQRLAEVSSAFSSRPLIWFQLWGLRNPNADWDTFDLAFLHQFQPDMRPILPEICWNQVEDWEIEWVNMRANLLQQPQIDPETTKFQSEQEITAVSAEIDEDQETKHKTAHQFSKNEPEEAEISDQAKFQTTQIHTNSSPNSQVKGEARITAITDQQLISQLRQDKVDEIELDVLGSCDGDVTCGSKEKHTGEWSELEKMVVARKPPWEPPDLNLKTVVNGGEMQRKTDPCLKTIPEASPCTTDGKAELRGTGNVTDLSPDTMVLGETATTKNFESAHYRSMDAGGERDTRNSSTENSTVEAERRRTLVEQTPVVTVGDEAASVLGGGSRAHAIRRAMLLNPPPLMAAVFPWNHGSEGTVARQQGDLGKGEIDLKHSRTQTGGLVEVGGACFSAVTGEFHSWDEEASVIGLSFWVSKVVIPYLLGIFSNFGILENFSLYALGYNYLF